MNLDPHDRKKIPAFTARQEHLLATADDSLKRIRETLQNLTREELLFYFDQALFEMNIAQRALIFEGLVYEQSIAPLTPEAVLAAVQQFHQHSLQGKYYAPFSINSKNDNWVPPETDAWFSELSPWLDRSCELVEEGQEGIAKQCLDLLMELINKMSVGEEIVFADEYGDWMIVVQHNYQAVYQQLG